MRVIDCLRCILSLWRVCIVHRFSLCHPVSTNPASGSCCRRSTCSRSSNTREHTTASSYSKLLRDGCFAAHQRYLWGQQSQQACTQRSYTLANAMACILRCLAHCLERTTVPEKKPDKVFERGHATHYAISPAPVPHASSLPCRRDYINRAVTVNCKCPATHPNRTTTQAMHATQCGSHALGCLLACKAWHDSVACNAFFIVPRSAAELSTRMWWSTCAALHHTRLFTIHILCFV